MVTVAGLDVWDTTSTSWSADAVTVSKVVGFTTVPGVRHYNCGFPEGFDIISTGFDLAVLTGCYAIFRGWGGISMGVKSFVLTVC